MKKRIHINQHNMRAVLKGATGLPISTTKTYKANHKGLNVRIHGPAELVVKMDDPLSCGARAWVETDSPVEIQDVDGNWRTVE